MEQFKPPTPLVLTGNLAENWRRWEQRFRLYMTATASLDKEEDVKIAILLHTVGEDALEVYNTLTVNRIDEENETMDDVLTAFRDYCSPQKNLVFERHQFWSHPMAEGISVDKFITELRQKYNTPSFGLHRSACQGWLGHFGATRVSDMCSSLTLANTCGRATGGNAYRCVSGNRCANASTRGVSPSRKNKSGHCVFSRDAKRSTSACPDLLHLLWVKVPVYRTWVAQ